MPSTTIKQNKTKLANCITHYKDFKMINCFYYSVYHIKNHRIMPNIYNATTVSSINDLHRWFINQWKYKLIHKTAGSEMSWIGVIPSFNSSYLESMISKEDRWYICF